MRKALIVFGIQGSGKGTQSQVMSARYGLPVICTGEILRAKARTDEKIKQMLAQGVLFPTEMINGFLEEEIRSLGDRDFIFDGYPRREDQFRALLDFEEKYSFSVIPVLLDVHEDEIKERLSKRFTCQQCGRVAPAAGVCSVCGGKLIKRADDTPQAIETRIKAFEKETKPIIKYYKDRGELITIDGVGTEDQVSERFYEKLDPHFKVPARD